MATIPTDALERLVQYNGNAVGVTNPYGFGYGGHRQNFPQALYDTAAAANFFAAAAAEAQASAGIAEAGATNAGNAATLASAWASNPENAVVAGGLYSARHYALKAAASAASAATFDPASFYTKAQIDVREWGTSQIANGAVTSGKLAAGAVVTAGLSDGSVTAAKLQNIPSRNIFSRSELGSGPPSLHLIDDFFPQVLVRKWDAADLNGLTQIIFDLPSGFSMFEIIAETLVSSSLGGITLRCGNAGGSLDAGASDYSVQTLTGTGSTLGAASPSSSSLGVGNTDSNGRNIIRIQIVDGSGGGNWRFLVTEGGPDSSGYRVSSRFGWRNVGGPKKRLGILFSQPLQPFGSIRIEAKR